MNEVLESIKKEFIQLRYRWEIFLQLFDSGEDNVKLLNESGSNVFQLLQKLVIDDTMQTLCRLTDPAISAGKENASIYNYLSKSILEADLQAQINKHLDELSKTLQPIRNTRNWAIAHSDLSVRSKVKELPRITYDNIEFSIETINKILNILSGSSDNYTPHIPFNCGGSKLLKVLADGQSRRKR